MGKQAALQDDQKSRELDWFTDPALNHVVHFYPFDMVLLGSLTEYFGQALVADETCIVIATPGHLASLNASLRSKGLDIARAAQSGQYIMFDANDMLSDFMTDELPDYEKFMSRIGRIISLAAGRGKPIRAFGEMVALLWESGNLDGLLQLEKFWHGLVEDQAFSLYCAYPKALFSQDGSHQAILDKICGCHSLTLEKNS